MNASFVWKALTRPILECRLFADVEKTGRTFICLVFISGLNNLNLEIVQLVGSGYDGKNFKSTCGPMEVVDEREILHRKSHLECATFRQKNFVEPHNHYYAKPT